MPVPPTADEIRLPLPRGGTLTATATADTSTGAVRYTVRTAHLHGVFLVHPHVVGGELLPCGVRVSFGDGAAPIRPYQPRPHEPIAHRVRIHGTATCATPDRLPDLRAVLVEPVVLAEHYATRRVPDGARALLEDAVLAVLIHWRTREDRPALVLAAARRAAPAVVRDTRSSLAAAEADLAAVEARALRHEHRLLQLERLAAAVPPPIAAPAGPARLVYTDEDGHAMGSARVRETAVGRPPGTVTYRVEGPRLAGSVVVGPYQHSRDPVPTGISVQYGTASDTGRHRDEPVVNGVRLRGAWDHSSTDPVTPSSPSNLPRPSRAEEPFSQPVPDATENRWWAVVRALAARYNERPDNQALRQAAAHARALQALDAVRETLGRLTEETTRLTATVNQLRQRLDDALALLR
ncbi:hypothetical protein [Streptomyces sp. NPDC046985]|uniref:hypothetical protein n=1 Tax=Streptomyces sp. NPDC046985 TaxID=3155377 RepID=UPI00340B55A4